MLILICSWTYSKSTWTFFSLGGASLPFSFSAVTLNVQTPASLSSTGSAITPHTVLLLSLCFAWEDHENAIKQLMNRGKTLGIKDLDGGQKKIWGPNLGLR